MWYVSPLVLTGLIAIGLGLFVWHRRPAPGAIYFALVMASVGQWSLGYAAELGSTAMELKLFWAKFEYLGIVAVPVLWLVFVLHYTGRDTWLSHRAGLLLTLEPLLVLLLVWTNHRHGLIWQDTRLITGQSLTFLDVTYGMGFWLHAGYAYLVLLVATVVLLQALARARHLYRRQTVVLLLGALAPWAGNLLYLLRATPVPQLDPTPFAFTITGLAFTWGLVRFRLFDIVPIARDAIIDSMSDGVLVLDAQDRVVDLNRAVAGIIGLREQALIGRRVDELRAELATLLEALRNGGEDSTEVTWRTGQEQRCFELRLSLLYHHGRSVGSVIFWRDMTEHKRAEETRFALLQEQAARSRAEDGMRARDAFLSIASHELRTPLTALLGHTEMLHRRAMREDRLDERDLQALDIIHKQAIRLNNQIEALLDVSRIERGQLSINPYPMDLCTLVRRVVAEMEPTLEYHTIQVTCTTGTLIVNGDELRLEQVLQNLLQNAIKYSPSGGLIMVQAHQHEGNACIAVTDHGIGIPYEAQAHLFEQFYRSTNVEPWQISGFGIGLYVVKELVARHGGTIEVCSSEGAGSTFTVRIPLFAGLTLTTTPSSTVTTTLT